MQQQGKHDKFILRLLLLVLTAFYCTFPLFIHQGLPYIDDMSFHVFQADQFSQAMKEGILYPRWLPSANQGYGGANFVFYSPLAYYLVSAVNSMISSLTYSMIVVIWFGFLFSGLAMLFATRRLFSVSGSLIAAIIYQILPFHLGDLYIRGTFAELFAFTWFPLIIYFMQKTFESKNKMAAVGLSLSYAGLILTHLVSAFIFTLVIGIYALYNCLKVRKFILKTFIALALGLGLSAIYILPAIVERQFVHIDYLVECSICDYRNNFLFTLDKFKDALRLFYMPLHMGVILETILFLFILLSIRKNKEIVSNRLLRNFFVFLFLYSFFLTIPLSRPLWDIIPGFSFLQFPWRWVSMMELSLCFLIGSFFSENSFSCFRSNNKRGKIIIYLIIILFVASLSMIFKNVSFSSNIHIKNMNIIEYTPKWVHIEKIMSERKNGKVSAVSGKAAMKVHEWKSEKRVVSIEAFSPTILRIATFYYPGWEAEIDGHTTQISIEKDSGAMLVAIPEGKHTLVVRFKDNTIRYYAKLVSLGSLFVIILWVLFSRKKQKEIETT